jgi:hypothetical protein
MRWQGCLASEQASMFFFEKKNQKTFATFTRDVSTSPGTQEQKFFGSFFQKRTSSFL